MNAEDTKKTNELMILLVEQYQCWTFANEHDVWDESEVKLSYDTLTIEIHRVISSIPSLNHSLLTWRHARDWVDMHDLTVPELTLDVADLTMDDQRIADIVERAVAMLHSTGLGIDECIKKITHSWPTDS